MDNNNSEYIIFHGLPGSGKSTLAAKLLEDLLAQGKDVINVNRDNLRTEFFGEDYHNGTPNGNAEKKVTEVMMERTLAQLARTDAIVINDDCNLNVKFLNKLRKDVAITGAHIVHVFVDTPPRVAQARNASRGAAGGRLVPGFVIGSMAKDKFTQDDPPVIDRSIFVLAGESVLTLT